MYCNRFKVMALVWLGFGLLPSTSRATPSYFQLAEKAFSEASPVALDSVVKEGPLEGRCVEERSVNFLKKGTLFLDRVSDPVLGGYVVLKYTYEGLLKYYGTQMTLSLSGDLEGEDAGGRGVYRLRRGTDQGGKKFWIFNWSLGTGYAFYCWQ